MRNLSFLNELDVRLHTCNEKKLIFIDEEKLIETDFFNLLFYDDLKRLNACDYLKKQEYLTIVEEPKSESGVYVFVNGRLFQEIAIENKWARINMDYDGFMFKLSREEIVVNAKTIQPEYENASITILTLLLLFFVICAGITSKL